MQDISVTPIGVIAVREGETAIQLEKAYAPALTGLAGFSHAQVLWWFSGCDDAVSRAVRTEERPYKNGPETLGTFATRSPQRPNPIAVSTAAITYVDVENGVLGLAYIDAWDGSPALDVKPYTPSLDRVEYPRVPDWCADWPNSCETSGAFDWAAVFNF